MSGTPPPNAPAPFEDDASRVQRAPHVERGNLVWKVVFLSGLAVLGVWAVLEVIGIGGLGLLLAPIGVCLVIGSGVLLFIDRISRL